MPRPDLDRLRAAAELSRTLVKRLLARGFCDETTAAGVDLCEAILDWHRAAEPRAYGRHAGDRP